MSPEQTLLRSSTWWRCCPGCCWPSLPRRPLDRRRSSPAPRSRRFSPSVYVAIIASAWGGSEGGFSSLDGVASLFANRWLLLAGWTHYLAFDLLVGGWEVRDARERGIPHLLVVPCLALTFMFGPAGWLLYQLIRRVSSR